MAEPVNRAAAPAVYPAVMVLLGLVLVGLALASITQGSSDIGIGKIYDAFFAFDGSRDHLVIASIRVPRVLAGILAGAALASAGAVMQAMAHNPLASPDLLGINAGAAFSVVVALSILGIVSQAALVWWAFFGAASAAATVYLFGASGWGNATPLKLVLAGAVLNAFLFSVTTAILVYDRNTLDAVRLWTAGSLVGRNMEDVSAVAPYIFTGLAAAILFSRQLTTMSMGMTMARSLGQSPAIWRCLAVVLVVLLAGGSVALAGPIGFVGLVMPHLVRMCVGGDYRWVVPFCAMGGALLVLLADTLGRTLFGNQAFPVGVTMALVGAPFFIWLARRRIGSIA
ncbi:iron ABC transporter permease [Fulvimarina sp. MAC8]|uniref:FecCD family ABC transporter permease n=1 Tax=Fulvimarina sp. MAC8 TaxID=3162874 RepID=UPI0032EFF175